MIAFMDAAGLRRSDAFNPRGFGPVKPFERRDAFRRRGYELNVASQRPSRPAFGARPLSRLGTILHGRCYLKKHDRPSAIVVTSRLRSRNRFRISQLVSAISRHPWHAAPWVARSPLLSSGS
jgi:hypothetical protein